jgi:hypothetical protein
MKTKISIAIGLIGVITVLPRAWTQENAALKEKVEALFNKISQSYRAKDFQGLASTFTEDYQQIFGAIGREVTVATIKTILKPYEKVSESHTILDITQSGNMVKVIFDGKLEGKTGNEKWKTVDQSTSIAYLVQKNGVFKVYRSAGVDKYRLTNVKGHKYEDGQTGFSFAAPPGWDIFPSVHPIVQGTVYALAPDKTSLAWFGFLRAPAGAQQAAEADEASARLLSAQDSYELYKSGGITVTGHEGYEIESKFLIPTSEDRHRRRVYFNASGLLYILCFDAIPANQWDKVKNDFQRILDTVKVGN